MASWVVELLFPFWIRVLWAGASASSYISLRWAASWGDRLGITGCAALGGVNTLGGGTNLGGSTPGGGTTLGCVTISEITGVASVVGLGGWKSIWRLFTLHGTGTRTGT